MRLKTRDTVFRLEFLCPHAVRIWWTPWWPPGHGLSFFVHTALVSEKSVLLFLAISPSACSTQYAAVRCITLALLAAVLGAVQMAPFVLKAPMAILSGLTPTALWKC